MVRPGISDSGSSDKSSPAPKRTRNSEPIISGGQVHVFICCPARPTLRGLWSQRDGGGARLAGESLPPSSTWHSHTGWRLCQSLPPSTCARPRAGAALRGTLSPAPRPSSCAERVGARCRSPDRPGPSRGSPLTLPGSCLVVLKCGGVKIHSEGRPKDRALLPERARVITSLQTTSRGSKYR